MRKISNITVVIGKETQTYSVGRHVSRINYSGKDYGTHHDDVFEVYDENGDLIAEAINLPTLVEYY